MPYAHFTRQERVTLACLLKHENSVRNISRGIRGQGLEVRPLDCLLQFLTSTQYFGGY